VSQANRPIMPDTCSIRPAMGQDIYHFFKVLPIRRSAIQAEYARDPAHTTPSLLVNNKGLKRERLSDPPMTIRPSLSIQAWASSWPLFPLVTPMRMLAGCPPRLINIYVARA
jgi:hypothetical protein